MVMSLGDMGRGSSDERDASFMIDEEEEEDEEEVEAEVEEEEE